MKTVLNPSWIEDLSRCPSQCECYFESPAGIRYCIYLRWRHGDPWTAQLVPVEYTTGKFMSGPWPYINVPDYIHDGYKNLQGQCISYVKMLFGDIKWLKK